MHSLVIAKTKFGSGDDAVETPQLFHYPNHLHNSFQPPLVVSNMKTNRA